MSPLRHEPWPKIRQFRSQSLTSGDGVLAMTG